MPGGGLWRQQGGGQGGPGDSAAEQGGGGGAGRVVWRLAERKLASNGRALFRYRRVPLLKTPISTPLVLRKYG